MKAIDTILGLLVQREGTELRLASAERPRMFRGDEELALTMPPTSTAGIQALLGDLWGAHAAGLQEGESCVFELDVDAAGTFAGTISRRPGGAIAVAIRRGPGGAAAPPSASSTAVADSAAPAASGAPASALPPAIVALLVRAAACGASDLHLSPGRTPVVRIDGTLRELDGEAPVSTAALLHDLPAGRAAERAFDVAGVGRVRLSAYASDAGVCAALRLLRREPPALAALALPAQLAALVDLPHGLVLAVGPTGSGKSTTLAALVQDALQRRARVLVTLEDPIEYVIRPAHAAGLVRQREIGTHVRDFASGLREALRADPDLLLVGEMRDTETISLALTAAETGHLVFASLHSRTAASAVERIVDAYPAERQRQVRVQLADALRAVIAQRLLPVAHGAGRVPAIELLRVTYGVANLIREGRTAQIISALQSGGGDGMLPLERHLADLVRAGRVSRADALAAANDAAALGDYLRGVP